MPTFQQDVTGQTSRLIDRLGFRTEKRQWVRAALLHGVILAAFGVFLPFIQGVGFFDSVVLGAYQAIAVVFAAPAAAVKLEPGASFRTALIHTGLCWLYGILMTTVMIVLGVVTVLTTATVFVGPSLEVFSETGIFAILLTLAVTLASTWLANQFSPGAAKMLVRVVFFSLLIVFFFRSRWLPDIALTGAAIAAVLAIVFLFLVRQAVSTSAEAKA